MLPLNIAMLGIEGDDFLMGDTSSGVSGVDGDDEYDGGGGGGGGDDGGSLMSVDMIELGIDGDKSVGGGKGDCLFGGGGLFGDEDEVDVGAGLGLEDGWLKGGISEVAKGFVKREARLLWMGIGGGNSGDGGGGGVVVKKEEEVVDVGEVTVGGLSEVERKRVCRRKAIERFRAKRANRSFRKRVRYACRKQLADSRPRVKGRFVKKTEMKLYKRFGPSYRNYLYLLERDEGDWDSLVADAEDGSSLSSISEEEEAATVPGSGENVKDMTKVEAMLCIPSSPVSS